ncbi:MAG: hypothetical protein J0L96_00610 [Anaerolineae bacterium]|nr:hypothetical protein [Anaerolineae bacterium]
MNKLRFFLITFGTANAGLILYGLIALLSPNILVETFSSSVYQIPATATAALSYLSALFRLLGFLNLILGITGLILLWRFWSDREPWVKVSIISISMLSYLGPIIFDNTVGSIGVFEFIKHLLFSGMLLSALTITRFRQLR